MSSAFRHVLALTGFVLASYTAAVANPQLIPDWKQSHFEEGNPAVRSLYILAVCARNHRRQAAEAMLRSAPGSAEEKALIPTVFPSGLTDCPIRTTELRIHSMTLVRGAVAEALYNGDRKKPRSTSVLPFSDIARQPEARSNKVVARLVAGCAVNRSPQLAHSVVSYNPGSVREARALRALRPILINCLPAGERLQVSRISMRALIAEELYQAAVRSKELFANA